MKTAIIVLSDPQNGEEALGRLFNALAAAYDFRQNKQEVALVFQGTGTRWPALLGAEAHPAYGLFQAVKDTVVGVSHACADIFGARDSAQQSGFDLITGNPVPGTAGLPSLAKYATEGYTVLTF
jgi:hypothetical protein